MAAGSGLDLPFLASPVVNPSRELAYIALYISAGGQVSFPRPMRKVSTNLLLPGSLPEKRLGLGSTAGSLKAEIHW